MKKAKTMNAFNLLYYTPKLWEKVVLFFCPLKTHEAPECVIWYKTFSNRMYIYGYIRSASADTYSAGLNLSQNQDQTSSGFENPQNN